MLSAILSGTLSLFHWKVMLGLALYAAIYVGVMYLIGSTNLLGGLSSSVLAMLGGFLAQILLQPVFLAALVDVVVQHGNVDLGRSFDHFAYLMLAGFVGWLFAIVLSWIPLVGAVLKSEIVSMVISSVPVTIAVLSPGLGFGTVIGASLSLVLDSWLFMAVLIGAAYVLQWVCVFVAMRAARAAGENLPEDGVAPGPVFGLTSWALQPFAAAFPVFALMHWIMANYAQ